jgi:hypothetical protein
MICTLFIPSPDGKRFKRISGGCNTSLSTRLSTSMFSLRAQLKETDAFHKVRESTLMLQKVWVFFALIASLRVAMASSSSILTINACL